MRRWCPDDERFRAAVEEAENAAEFVHVSNIHLSAHQAEVIEHFDARGNLLSRRVKRDPKVSEWCSPSRAARN
jgi:hypothetical protein